MGLQLVLLLQLLVHLKPGFHGKNEFNFVEDQQSTTNLLFCFGFELVYFLFFKIQLWKAEEGNGNGWSTTYHLIFKGCTMQLSNATTILFIQYNSSCPFTISSTLLLQVFDNGSTCRVGTLDGPFSQFACLRNIMHKAGEEANNSENMAAADDKGNATLKKKKLKGKRAVVRWLKFFRWKKKKDYERMTAEEKILYKLKKARNKEARLVEALQKIEPPDSSEPIHDPEILTPEEHFYFLKMGIKCKNYVPVGRRGIYQGVILNMHLHWKKHQTLKVVVKTFTPEEVKEIASELARLSGGIVLDIQEDNTIIMYRGKNYSQPPTEIMSPKSTLPRIKALNKSKYRDGLRAVRKFIPRLEHDLDLLQEQAKRKQEIRSEHIENIQETENAGSECGDIADQQQSRYNIRKRINRDSDLDEESTSEAGITSDSDCLSDIFATDSDGEVEKAERPLFLDVFEKIPAERNEDADGFEEHLRQISQNSKKGDHVKKDVDLPYLDEVDRIFLRAGSLLRKKRR